METIAGQNLSQGPVDTVMKVLQMQAENARASMNAGVAMRGQDVDQQNAMLRAQTEVRGQDLQNASWKERNDIERQQGIDDAAYKRGMLENQQKNTEINLKEHELQQKQADLAEAKKLLIADAYQKGGWEGMKAALASNGEYKMALDIQDAQDRLNKNQYEQFKDEREFQRNIANDEISNAQKQASMDKDQFELNKGKAGMFATQEMARIAQMPDGPEKIQAMRETAGKVNNFMGFDMINPDNPEMGLKMYVMESSETLQKNPLLARDYMSDGQYKDLQAGKNKGGGLDVEFGPDGEITNLSVGGKGNKAAETKAIEKYNAAVQFGDSLKDVKANYKESLLGWRAKGKDFWIDIKDKAEFELNDDQKQFLRDREAISYKTEVMFNAYRVATTGAAASEKELQRIRDMFINSDLGSERFEARLEAMYDSWEKEIARTQSTLEQGGISSSGFDRAKEDNSSQSQPAQDREAELRAHIANLKKGSK